IHAAAHHAQRLATAGEEQAAYEAEEAKVVLLKPPAPELPQGNAGGEVLPPQRCRCGREVPLCESRSHVRGGPMDRALFFSRTPLRNLVAVALASITLWAAAAHAVSDGLTISGNGYTQLIAGHPYSFTPTTRNPSGRKLVFSIANKPAWASFSSATGRL